MTAAIDFGKGQVKVALRRGDEVRVAALPVDPELAGDERIAALAGAAKQAASVIGLKPGTRVHAAVPRALAIVKSLVLPDVPKDEIEPLLRFQAAKVLPFPLTEMALAWSHVGQGPHGGQRYALAAVRGDTLAELRALIEAAGFKPGRLEVSSQAVARALGLPEGDGETLALDVGHKTTDVVLLEQGQLLFSRSASVGVGTEGFAERLAQEVVRSLVAARTEAGASERIGPPDRLILSGGGGQVEGVAQIVGDALRTKVEVFGPSGLVDASGGPLSPGEAGGYLVAVGLLGGEESVVRLDFAGQERADAHARGRNRVVAGAIAGCVALALAIGGGEAYLSGLEASIQEFEAERAQLEPSVKRAKAVRAELREVQAWDARKGRELEALHAISLSLPDADRAYLTQLRWSEGQAIRVVGRAKNGAAAEEFFTQLEADPRIASATIEQIRQPRGTALGVEFSGQIRLVDSQRGTP